MSGGLIVGGLIVGVSIVGGLIVGGSIVGGSIVAHPIVGGSIVGESIVALPTRANEIRGGLTKNILTIKRSHPLLKSAKESTGIHSGKVKDTRKRARSRSHSGQT